jgi:hypothetical protein
MFNSKISKGVGRRYYIGIPARLNEIKNTDLLGKDFHVIVSAEMVNREEIR